MRDFRSERYNNNRPRRDYTEQQGSNNNQVVGAVFREPVHQVLEKVKNESFFKWPNKMMGNPEAKPKSLLSIPSRPWSHYRELQKFMGSLGPTCPRRQIETVVTSL